MRLDIKNRRSDVADQFLSSNGATEVSRTTPKSGKSDKKRHKKTIDMDVEAGYLSKESWIKQKQVSREFILSTGVDSNRPGKIRAAGIQPENQSYAPIERYFLDMAHLEL